MMRIGMFLGRRNPENPPVDTSAATFNFAVGYFGGFGPLLADWLADHGCPGSA